MSNLKKLPEVFAESEAEIIHKQNKRVRDVVLDTEAINETDSLTIEPVKLPEHYKSFSVEKPRNTLSQKALYTKIQAFTPYLIKSLLFLTQDPLASARDRIQASRILLDKVMPNLNAEHIKLEADNFQSLVIVKAKKEEEPSE